MSPLPGSPRPVTKIFNKGEKTKNKGKFFVIHIHKLKMQV